MKVFLNEFSKPDGCEHIKETYDFTLICMFSFKDMSAIIDLYLIRLTSW